MARAFAQLFIRATAMLCCSSLPLNAAESAITTITTLSASTNIRHIDGFYIFTSALPGSSHDVNLVFSPTPVNRQQQKITLTQISVNKALRQGQSYRIVATLDTAAARTQASEAISVQQLLIYLPEPRGFTIPLWLNAPRNSGQAFGEVGYLKMDLPFGGALAIR